MGAKGTKTRISYRPCKLFLSRVKCADLAVCRLALTHCVLTRSLSVSRSIRRTKIVSIMQRLVGCHLAHPSDRALRLHLTNCQWSSDVGNGCHRTLNQKNLPSQRDHEKSTSQTWHGSLALLESSMSYRPGHLGNNKKNKEDKWA